MQIFLRGYLYDKRPGVFEPCPAAMGNFLPRDRGFLVFRKGGISGQTGKMLDGNPDPGRKGTKGFLARGIRKIK